MSKMKEWLLDRQLNGDDGTGHCDYEVGEVCLACSQSYPPNGILFCDDCGIDKDMEQQKEREGDNV